MAKFYVQSGTMRKVIQADSRRKAALWAVHEALQQILPMEDTETDSLESKSEAVSNQGVAVLAAKVTVSERGFEGSDATSLPTLEVVTEWNEMVTTLNRLQQMLYRAA